MLLKLIALIVIVMINDQFLLNQFFSFIFCIIFQI
nr:MAG TPA: hypothetical protein [Caudoviricetes sp.]